MHNTDGPLYVWALWRVFLRKLKKRTCAQRWSHVLFLEGQTNTWMLFATYQETHARDLCDQSLTLTFGAPELCSCLLKRSSTDGAGQRSQTAEAGLWARGSNIRLMHSHTPIILCKIRHLMWRHKDWKGGLLTAFMLSYSGPNTHLIHSLSVTKRCLWKGHRVVKMTSCNNNKKN